MVPPRYRISASTPEGLSGVPEKGFQEVEFGWGLGVGVCGEWSSLETKSSETASRTDTDPFPLLHASALAMST